MRGIQCFVVLLLLLCVLELQLSFGAVLSKNNGVEVSAGVKQEDEVTFEPSRLGICFENLEDRPVAMALDEGNKLGVQFLDSPVFRVYDGTNCDEIPGRSFDPSVTGVDESRGFSMNEDIVALLFRSRTVNEVESQFWLMVVDASSNQFRFYQDENIRRIDLVAVNPKEDKKSFFIVTFVQGDDGEGVLPLLSEPRVELFSYTTAEGSRPVLTAGEVTNLPGTPAGAGIINSEGQWAPSGERFFVKTNVDSSVFVFDISESDSNAIASMITIEAPEARSYRLAISRGGNFLAFGFFVLPAGQQIDSYDIVNQEYVSSVTIDGLTSTIENMLFLDEDRIFMQRRVRPGGFNNFQVINRTSGEILFYQDDLSRAEGEAEIIVLSPSSPLFAVYESTDVGMNNIQDIRASLDVYSYATLASSTLTPVPTAEPTDPPGSATPEATATNPPEDDSVCFPGSALVELQNGNRVPMKDLQEGDHVRVSVDKFSPVIFFSHKVSDRMFEFVQISWHSASGKEGSLTLSDSHFVYVDGSLVAAKYAEEGQFVSVWDDALLKMVNARISSIRKVRELGLYNPHTSEGEMVVENVLVSCYTQTFDAWLAHALLMPVRIMYSAFHLNILGKLLEPSRPGWAMIGFWSKSIKNMIMEKSLPY
mmetsp:Transcript_2270/g.3988  ORF Transcript_2270/g.3988 Transcript_2270/m.3988 type:complete len:649 (-) Transcript_2270:201-2147(-)|eukprot:CAMPEP_0182449822 /NCGR_PEP_ID=MMETSP1172-20130603/36941_1 /TAXON_ID=708627 /ORGANISM="Timspurckia oligopyrenoides, Strain CCMP3278" /LENGTH=648 /DNA_ID=CAMNT_0024647211 /DNA_START=46 /DNA_END=1992 /DNA_ORIENTATION=+